MKEKFENLLEAKIIRRTGRTFNEFLEAYFKVDEITKITNEMSEDFFFITLAMIIDSWCDRRDYSYKAVINDLNSLMTAKHNNYKEESKNE